MVLPVVSAPVEPVVHAAPEPEPVIAEPVHQQQSENHQHNNAAPPSYVPAPVTESMRVHHPASSSTVDSAPAEVIVAPVASLTEGLADA